MTRYEGPSEADIEASERAASGTTGRWLARAGIIFLLIALASLIVPAIMLLFPPETG